MSRVTHISNFDQFNQYLQNHRDQNIIVKCGTPWCSPCRRMQPKFEAWSNESEYKSILFLEVNVDEIEMEFGEKYSITSLPTFLFIYDRKIVQRVNGPNQNQIIQVMRNLAQL